MEYRTRTQGHCILHCDGKELEGTRASVNLSFTIHKPVNHLTSSDIQARHGR
jgi:hypothetical protein